MTVVGHDVEKGQAVPGTYPVFDSPGACRFAGKKGFGILKNHFFEFFIAETELTFDITAPGNDGAVMTFAVVTKGKEMGLRLGKTLDKKELSKSVAVGEIEGAFPYTQ